MYLRKRPRFHGFEMDGFMGRLSFVHERDGERFYWKVLEQGVKSCMTSENLYCVLGLTGLELPRGSFEISITRTLKGLQKLPQIPKPRHFRRKV